jgi:hypothetical protein
VVAVAAITLTAMLGAVPAAQAGSGVYCSWCDLNSGGKAVGNYRGYWYETESWNSDAKGVGSCTGIGNSSGSFSSDACHGDGSGYNEVYDGPTGWSGYAIMENDSNHGYNSVFSGWEWYA